MVMKSHGKSMLKKRGHPGNRKDEVWRPPGELGVSKSLNCETYSSQCFDAVVWPMPTGMASGR